MMVSEARVRQLLEPFGLRLDSQQIAQLVAYLDLLLFWNRRINLTAIRDPEACVTRHFGESLYPTRWVELHGKLLDVGSGAGFPGLALKMAAPALSITLLEPVAKKRAFLKEAVRVCGMNSVEVRGERLEDFARLRTSAEFETATVRAVGHLEKLVPLAVRCLKSGGRLLLWVSSPQATELRAAGVVWARPIHIPLSQQREIWYGIKR